MIRFDRVSKTFPGGVDAVHDLSMEVAKGETLVLLGSSGCGKTTTLKMINRLIEPSSGTITVDGTNILDRDPVVNELREKAARLIKNPPAAPDDLTIQRYMTALLFEDGMDIVENDPEAAAMILNLAVHEMLQFCFIRAGTFIPRIKSLLTELEKLDPQVTALARDYFRTAAIKDRVKLATSIADLTVEARGFFEWEKHREVLN